MRPAVALTLMLLLLLEGCTSVGSYATSLGIEDAAQIKGAEADYLAALAGFSRAGVLTPEEAELEYHSERMRLNEGTWSKARLEGYRQAVLRGQPRVHTYKQQCFWVDARKDVRCKGQLLISGIGK
ncbi:hypothetical protein [Nitrospira lenta]|uniref:Lipoprotein n=1 Tax=Nitrospira lenta TaxID=1436998 RepID=A0A330LE39_9BACT|nr:hypothetical protein [Nitrospira lenta]SPP65220.1 exported hypothetical protein [Nitrospira lenta]